MKCSGCGASDCSHLWKSQRKCCPDCSHGKERKGLKMENGSCPTWFVQKWLEKHLDHTAKAPNTDELWPCEASTDGMHIGFRTKWPPEYDWQEDDSPPIRNDWTIFDEKGEPVEFKRKRKTRVVGKLCDGENLVVVDALRIHFWLHHCKSKSGYDVLLRKRSK